VSQTPQTVTLQGSTGTTTGTTTSKFAVIHAATLQFSTTWTLVSGQLRGSPQDCYLTPVSQELLVVNSTCLIPGQLYRFRFTVTTQTGASTNATVLLRAATNPSGGMFEVSPAHGTIDTNFKLSAIGFTSPNPPLRYSFAYVGDGISKVLHFPSHEASISNVHLPAGANTVQVTVTDATNHQTTVSIDVNVAASGDDSTYESALQALLVQIPAAIQWKDYHRVGNLITKIAFFLNCTSVVPAADQVTIRIQLLELVAAVANATSADAKNMPYLFSLVSAVLELPQHITSEIQSQALNIIQRLVDQHTLSSRDGTLLLSVISSVISALPNQQQSQQLSHITSTIMHNIASSMVSGQRQSVVRVNNVAIGVAVGMCCLYNMFNLYCSQPRRSWTPR